MRSRRALSTVVGAVFAIIALTSTVTYVSYSMGILDNYNQSVLTKNQQLSDVNKEKFQISSVTVPNGKLNITVTNTGSVPINFTKIWIQNQTAYSNGVDWVNSYVPTNSFVAPGGVLIKMGQKIPLTINSAYSYNVKLVTSRGNTQQFSVNSANTAPLNIQTMFLPTTVSTGFKTELLMVVINNSTGTLTNVSPSSLPSPTYGIGNTGNLQCNAGVVSPVKYDTLAPGSVAFFTWDITTTGGNGGDTCTYNITQPLRNGYLQSTSPPTPLTITVVSLSSTTYAQNSGVVTIDYTSFRWTQGGTWHNDWQFSGNTVTDFKMQFANNNQTVGPQGQQYKLWLSKHSQMVLTPTDYGTGNSVHVPYTFFITKPISDTPSTPPSLTGYTDYFQGISSQGGVGTVYFGAYDQGSDKQLDGSSGRPSPLAPGTYYGIIIIYGKFTVNANDNTGGQYAQTLPFMAVITN